MVKCLNILSYEELENEDRTEQADLQDDGESGMGAEEDEPGVSLLASLYPPL